MKAGRLWELAGSQKIRCTGHFQEGLEVGEVYETGKYPDTDGFAWIEVQLIGTPYSRKKYLIGQIENDNFFWVFFEPTDRELTSKEKAFKQKEESKALGLSKYLDLVL